MDSFQDHLGIVPGQYFVEKLLGSVLGKVAVLSPFHIKTLDFELLNVLAIDFSHVDSSILLLCVQQQSTKDIVNVNLQQLVSFIDRLLEIVTDT